MAKSQTNEQGTQTVSATKKTDNKTDSYVRYIRVGSKFYGVLTDGTRVLLDQATLKPIILN